MKTSEQWREKYANLWQKYCDMEDERDRLAEDKRELVEALEPVLADLSEPKVVHIGVAFNRYQVSYMVGYYDPIKQALATLDRIKAREVGDDD